ncbi:SAM-dependent methyltransferase [Actinoplanes rectilineatus]|uniref:SAM-dependent methyltransferase n=1 Tax=Actinoplanes rectilineatus TaxID=113571 RepID=UPI0006973CDB|nr:class I SAM-dependent methyltransferase [Actinoplanes rectilineatus]
MHDADTEAMTRLQQAFTARDTVQGWAAAAKALALLGAVRDAGLMTVLDGGDLRDLAARTGIGEAQARDVVTVLAAMGVVTHDDGRLGLTPAFGVLARGRSAVSLDSLLDQASAEIEETRRALTVPPGHPPDGAAALALAATTGVRVDRAAIALYRSVHDAVPEFSGPLAAGGTLLDVGSGVGGALLTTAVLFPAARATGVEVIAAVAEETRRRAAELGVADRVEVRTGDAAELTDEAVYDVAFWAHPFFADTLRARTLGAVRRALRPGGVLLMQELHPPAGDAAPDLVTAQEVLLHRRRGITYARSAEDLTREAAANGFDPVRIARTPLGRVVLAARPTTAGEEDPDD